MEPWAAAKKRFKLVWRCNQFLSGFLSSGRLPQVSRQSHLLANDKCDMRWYGMLCTDPLEFTLYLKKKHRKPQLGDRRWRLFDQSSTQMRSLISKLGRYDRRARQERRRKERKKGRGHPRMVTLVNRNSGLLGMSCIWDFKIFYAPLFISIVLYSL